MDLDFASIPKCNHSLTGHVFYHIFCPHPTTVGKISSLILGIVISIGLAWGSHYVLSRLFIEDITKKTPLRPEAPNQPTSL